MSEGIQFPLSFENFICEPYESSFSSYLTRFDALKLKDENGLEYTPIGLEKSIRDSGRKNDAQLLRTYLVFRISEDNKKELACVFCIRCSSMHFENPLRENFFSEIIPCIELVYLAVDANCLKRHPEIKGIGSATFDAFIVPIIQELNRLCGCKNLFLFAINNKKLIKYYIDRMDFKTLPEEQEKFVVNNLKTTDNLDCKFLYQPIECM
ncbi:MAG: hypothetical protein IJ688_05195 [Treponema sp.]|nr:hypothetical protein [Treponema sp.]